MIFTNNVTVFFVRIILNSNKHCFYIAHKI